jgi:hypothetical protein
MGIAASSTANERRLNALFGRARASEEMGRSFDSIAEGELLMSPLYRGAAPQRRAPGAAMMRRGFAEANPVQLLMCDAWDNALTL